MNPLLNKFRGTGVALVTPFKNGKIDFDALEGLVERVITGGVESLVCLGTTGESAMLSDKEHRQVIDKVIQVNKRRVPVVVGVFGGNNTEAMADKLRDFDFEGIDVVLSSNPSYVKPSQEGIYQHYMALAEASPRPIIIYNVPSRTSSNLTAETTLRLAHASEKFIAVKEASDDMMQIMKIIKGKPEHFLVLSGDDFLSLPIIAAGGDGVVSVIANTLPGKFSTMIRAALAHDLKKAIPLNLQMLDLYKLLFVEGNPVGVKAALEIQGVCNRSVRLPLSPMTEAGVNAIRAALLACGE